MRRVRAAVQNTPYRLQWDAVQYLDETLYEGPMGIFTKVSDFEYQSEFRIALLPGTGAALRLEVGDLSDIVMLGSLPSLNDRLKLRVNADGKTQLLIRNE